MIKRKQSQSTALNIAAKRTGNTMQLYFIRHGESVNNANWTDPNYVENPDPYLTEKGLAQAEQLAQHLKSQQPITADKAWNVQNHYGYGLTRIYASLMERAAMTAVFTVRALGDVPFSAWVDIHEAGGIYARKKEENKAGLSGKPRSYFEKHLPEMKLPADYGEDGWWNRPFESDAERDARAERVFSELLSRHGDRENQPEERIAFFSHGEFFVRLMGAMLKLPYKQGAYNMKSWFLLNNCSISRFDIHADRITIMYLNRTDHLPAQLVNE
jgi:2,3-bisphosphoglycerate-dependent phosphoglycerate mutase